MADFLLPNLGRGSAAFGPGYLGETHDRRLAANVQRANATFERLAEVPEKDDLDGFGGPEKAWAFYLMALWQLVTWSDVAESWARPKPSRRSNSLRAAGPED